MRGTQSLELLDEWQPQVREHLSEQLTDQFGQYRKGSSEMSDGEEHNLELEQRHRAAKNIAKQIDALTTDVEGWYFAAPREINQELLDEMNQGTRKKIEKNVPADLTKVTPDQIIKHLCE